LRHSGFTFPVSQRNPMRSILVTAQGLDQVVAIVPVAGSFLKEVPESPAERWLSNA
jgi:hypothetical protein